MTSRIIAGYLEIGEQVRVRVYAPHPLRNTRPGFSSYVLCLPIAAAECVSVIQEDQMKRLLFLRDAGIAARTNHVELHARLTIRFSVFTAEPRDREADPSNQFAHGGIRSKAAD